MTPHHRFCRRVGEPSGGGALAQALADAMDVDPGWLALGDNPPDKQRGSMRPFHLGLLLLLACSSGASLTDPPAGALSTDFLLSPVGGHNGYTGSPRIWQDSTVSEVIYRRQTLVRGAIVHYRATSGTVIPAVDTSNASGQTLYVWRVPLDVASSGELFACVEANDGCADQRLVGFKFTPGS